MLAWTQGKKYRKVGLGRKSELMERGKVLDKN